MLEVGNGGMSFGEYRSHFSIWALAKVSSDYYYEFNLIHLLRKNGLKFVINIFVFCFVYRHL